MAAVRRILTYLPLLLLFAVSGCAMVLAPSAEDAADLSKVHIGATQAQIENELGTPRAEFRGDYRNRAHRVREYKIMVREDVGDSDFTNSMIGFKEQTIAVHYNKANIAIRVIRNPRARTSLN